MSPESKTGLKAGIAYALYAVLALAGFAVLLFPSKEIGAYVARRAEAALPGVKVEIGAVSPAFPWGVTLAPVRLSSNRPASDATDAPAAVLDQVRLTPRPLSLLGDRPVADFRVSAYEGAMTGTVSRDRKTTEPVSVDATFSGIRLERIEALARLLKGQVVSSVKGAASGTLTGGTKGMESVVTLSDVKAGLESPLVPITELGFSSVKTKMTLDANRRLTLTEGTATGPQADVTLTGTVDLRFPPGGSELNLSGTLTPHPPLLKELGGAGTLLFGGKRQGGLPFTVAGTPDHPRIAPR